MDIATIIAALIVSGIAGAVSAIGTLRGIKVHIAYLSKDNRETRTRVIDVEKRIGRTEVSVAELQTKTKGI